MTNPEAAIDAADGSRTEKLSLLRSDQSAGIGALAKPVSSRNEVE